VNGRKLLRLLNDARLPYFVEHFALMDANSTSFRSKEPPLIVDVGCGGGFVTEELAAIGFVFALKILHSTMQSIMGGFSGLM